MIRLQGNLLKAIHITWSDYNTGFKKYPHVFAEEDAIFTITKVIESSQINRAETITEMILRRMMAVRTL